MIDQGSQFARLRVLIVGAGRRVQNNFLPALACLSSTMDVVGIHSRTLERLVPVAERWGIPPIPRLTDVDFSSIDVVAISVPTAQNAVVLRQILPYAPSLKIVIDTPVAWNRHELSVTLPLVKKFKSVIVTEDYMNFPTFTLLRSAVQGGLVGKLRGVTLYNTGFIYHGLALMRSLVGFRRARSTWSRAVGSFSHIVGYSFGDGFKGIVVGPYRKHTTGGITIEGTRGILTDFPGDDKFGAAAGRPVYTVVNHRNDDGMLSGISLDGAGAQYTVQLPGIAQMAQMDLQDRSDLNLLRGCGLIEVFKATYDPDNMNNQYGIENAFYDSFVPRIAQRGLLPFDPFVWFGSDCIKILSSFSKAS